MAEHLDETVQLHIEYRESGEETEGDVIIIYNYDGAELTPELLARTLEELSAQTSLRKNAAKQNLLVDQQSGTPGEYLADQIVVDTSSHLDSEFISMPTFKIDNENDIECNAFDPLIEENKHLDSIKSDLDVEMTGVNEELSSGNIILKEVKGELLTEITESVNKPCSANLSYPVQDIVFKDESIVPFKAEVAAFDTSDEEGRDNKYACDKCSFESSVELELQRHRGSEHKEASPFVCRHCGKAFRVELSLEVHKIAHSIKAKSQFSKFDPGFIRKVMKFFSCPLCDFKYQRQSQLSRHIKSLHPDENYLLCQQCPFSCLTQEVLDTHISSPAHEEDKRTLCPICGTATKDIRQHLKRTHTEERPFLCSECGFKAKTATNLSTHMIIHDPVKRVTCDLCSYKCRSKDQLKRHLVKHSNDKNFLCSLCNFACKTAMSLKRHMQIHQAPNKYVCSVCKFTTHDKVVLRQHKSQEHVLKPLYKCQECNIEFERAAELKKHALSVHKSDRIHFCSYCDFSGETVTDLRVHLQSHFGKFSYTCSQCGYMCRLKASYRRHMERHENIKKFACSLCSYSCVEKYDLHKHYSHRHSDEKPVSCPFCSYKCKFQPRLNNHIAYVHSDAKPFACKKCPYAGKSVENLKKHMVTHGVVVKAIQCVLCDYTTAERTKLKRHMQIHVKKAIFQ
ncbi:unnamed protein product [Candidula unifasciata]|uniref:C2H2-type domain-containing protein n=1 Tax=Candidula unifasciata TaxID=100452 RepID=A0A8S4A2H0_9EUPU|nr:unnamed protein product [Candidula unifasciata]